MKASQAGINLDMFDAYGKKRQSEQPPKPPKPVDITARTATAIRQVERMLPGTFGLPPLSRDKPVRPPDKKRKRSKQYSA